MISAWKRFVQKNNNNDAGANQFHCQANSAPSSGLNRMPNGIQKLDRNLQRKFARGVQYNMKIVIKGDQRVGKTCLFKRLRGEEFLEEYNPTDEIQATTIHWNYKATDDVVKIDVWEAIDLAKKKRRQTPDLKLENNNVTNNNNDHTTSIEQQQTAEGTSTNDNEQPALDASFIDVYKNANGVLLVFDMTKSWTFRYIQNEILKIPAHLPILIISNHRDMGHHRAITSDQVKTFIEGLDRSPGDGQVLYAEASMKNGFGLRFIHKFFNIPFLHLQETTLLKQLEINRFDLNVTQEELCIMRESEDEEYEKFLEIQTIRRRQKADMMSPASGAVSANRSAAIASGKSVPPIALTTNPISSDSNSRLNQSERPEDNPNQIVFNRSPSIIIGANRPIPEKINLKSKSIQLTHNDNHNQKVTNSQTSNGLPFQRQSNETSDNVSKNQVANAIEENVQDEEDDNSDDSNDNPTANPLVANYQNELDPDDICEGVETGQHMSDR